MPHIIVEYSANLETDVPPQALVHAIHATIRDCGTFNLGAIRTRAERRDVFEIADGDPTHGFISVTVLMAPGRDAETKKHVSALLMDVLERETKTVFDTRGLALTVYIQELDDASVSRKNNLHERMKGKH
jgi:5-carboxymethyl-2-hydroxymuconate isomerase